MEDLNKAYEINELIKESKEYRKLKKIEDKMSKDNNLQLLLSDYKAIQDKYNKCVNDKESLTEVRKDLSMIKCKVDTYHLTIKYNKQYKKVEKMLQKLNNVILEDIL